jgi:alpha-D-ribose 1-methylphosphonate 5-triphosphate synthase subunit PhnG
LQAIAELTVNEMEQNGSVWLCARGLRGGLEALGERASMKVNVCLVRAAKAAAKTLPGLNGGGGDPWLAREEPGVKRASPQ